MQVGEEIANCLAFVQEVYKAVPYFVWRYHSYQFYRCTHLNFGFSICSCFSSASSFVSHCPHGHPISSAIFNSLDLFVLLHFSLQFSHVHVCLLIYIYIYLTLKLDSASRRRFWNSDGSWPRLRFEPRWIAFTWSRAARVRHDAILHLPITSQHTVHIYS